MPKVTVVIPSYNHGRFLRRRFETVLGQTYRDYEILFLDDASTDDSLEVFSKYKDLPNLRAILNKTNSGSVFKQWNEGVRQARGDYIWLAESDDASDPRFLQTLVEILDAHTNVGLAYANSVFIDEEDRQREPLHTYVGPLHQTRWHHNFINNGLDECRRYLCLMNTIPNASAVVFRKQLYEKVGGADETKRLCGDWVTWIKLALAGDIAFVTETLNHYRVPHEKSVRRNTMAASLFLEEYLAIVKMIGEKTTLPEPVNRMLLDNLARQWWNQAHHGHETSHPLNYVETLRRASALKTEYLLAILSSGLVCSIDNHRLLADNWRALHAAQEEVKDLSTALLNQTTLVAEMKRTMQELRQQLSDQFRNEITAEMGRIEGSLLQLDGKVAEHASAMRFWNRLRRVLLPQGGWRHRLARGMVRLFRRKAS